MIEVKCQYCGKIQAQKSTKSWNYIMTVKVSRYKCDFQSDTEVMPGQYLGLTGPDRMIYYFKQNTKYALSFITPYYTSKKWLKKIRKLKPQYANVRQLTRHGQR